MYVCKKCLDILWCVPRGILGICTREVQNVQHQGGRCSWVSPVNGQRRLHTSAEAHQLEWSRGRPRATRVVSGVASGLVASSMAFVPSHGVRGPLVSVLGFGLCSLPQASLRHAVRCGATVWSCHLQRLDDRVPFRQEVQPRECPGTLVCWSASMFLQNPVDEGNEVTVHLRCCRCRHPCCWARQCSSGKSMMAQCLELAPVGGANWVRCMFHQPAWPRAAAKADEYTGPHVHVFQADHPLSDFPPNVRKAQDCGIEAASVFPSLQASPSSGRLAVSSFAVARVSVHPGGECGGIQETPVEKQNHPLIPNSGPGGGLFFLTEIS